LSNRDGQVRGKIFREDFFGMMDYALDPARNGTVLDQRYELLETLGKGKFAVVKLARHLLTDVRVAIKIIDKNKLDEVSKTHLYKEVTCMKLLRHPNVIRLYEAIDTTNHLFLVMELGDAGDLYDYIRQFDNGLDEARAKLFFAQMVTAIDYCHYRRVVHRDLKPENMVISSENESVKLTDFGFSNVFEEGKFLQTSCGSLAYSAPEILLGEEYDASAVDVWSLGVILYMLLCGEAPFNETNDSETLTMIMDCRYTDLENVSDECNDLIRKILKREPSDRLKIAEILKHDWLKDLGEAIAANHAEHLEAKTLVQSRDHNRICQFLLQSGVVTDAEAELVASDEEITQAILKDDYNPVTAAYLLFAEKLERTKGSRRSTRTTPRSTHISPNPSQPPSPRSTSPTPGQSPPRTHRLSGKMSPAPPLPREHLTITPRKGPVTKEGIEHLAEEERTSRSQTTTDDEDEREFRYCFSPDEALFSHVSARLRAAGGELRSKSISNSRTSDKKDWSNQQSSRTSYELNEIFEEPESELDDFDVEASPRQNRLNMGTSPSCARRRQRREEYSSFENFIPPSSFSTASSDSESSESRRTSSRDLSAYAAQLKNSQNRRDSSEEREPPSSTSFRNDSSMSNQCPSSNAKTSTSAADETSTTTKSTENNSNSKNENSQKAHEPKHQRRRRKKRNPQKQGSHEQMLDSIAEKGDSGAMKCSTSLPRRTFRGYQKRYQIKSLPTPLLSPT